ncbi:FAD-dependent oxidoreductase [Spirosoma harenae]
MTHSVLVVGAGPVGLVMAAELARHGIRCRIIDALPQPSPFCRALAVTARTLEVWENMGILHEAIDAGIWISGRRVTIGGGPARDFVNDLADCPYAPLSLPQPETERILTRQLQTVGITIERGVTLTDLVQDTEGVTVQLLQADGAIHEGRFRYVIGCDGAHSFVRKAAGIDFEGETMPFAFMLGDVRIDWQVPRGISFQSIYPAADTAPEFFVAIPLPEPNRYRVSMLAPMDVAPPDLTLILEGTNHGRQSDRSALSLDYLQTKADQLVGEPALLSDLRWSSIFRISMRLASAYQADNLFLAGDAAHIHPPTGGQGMNTGIQDAYNLAWKMALVLKGISPASLLDSYSPERREEGENVIDRSLRAATNTGASGFKTDRLADTQLLVSYRNSPWVDSMPEEDRLSALQPGDRAPDCLGLRRVGVNYPLRLFDVLRGTAHVLLIYRRDLIPPDLDDLHALQTQLQAEFGEKIGVYLRMVVISPAANGLISAPGIAFLHDQDGSFARTYGAQNQASWLIRPDGYSSWYGTDYMDQRLLDHLRKIFLSDSLVPAEFS